MRPGETLLDMVRRHVRRGAAHVRQQEELVRHLEATGSPLLEDARALLAEFIASQTAHLTHLGQLEDEVRAGRRDAGGNLRLRI